MSRTLTSIVQYDANQHLLLPILSAKTPTTLKGEMTSILAKSSKKLKVDTNRNKCQHDRVYTIYSRIIFATATPTVTKTHNLFLLNVLDPLVLRNDPQHESRLYETPLALAATSKTDPLKLPKL